jgi:hypothetical protein
MLNPTIQYAIGEQGAHEAHTFLVCMLALIGGILLVSFLGGFLTTKH